MARQPNTEETKCIPKLPACFFCGGELTTFQLSWWGGHILPSYLQGILWIEDESPGIESALLNALPPNFGRVHF